MEQLLLHLLGDFVIQNDWMALNKKKPSWLGHLACQIHCILYSLPFLLVGNLQQVFLIYLGHFIIDRWDFIGCFLAARNGVWDVENFGFSHERPKFISVWLYIITDNTFHLIWNYGVLN